MFVVHQRTKSVPAPFVSLTWKHWKLSLLMFLWKVDYASLSIPEVCLHNNCALPMISPRSWLLQLMTASLVTWQTYIYSQCLPTLSHILWHVFSSKVLKSVLKQEQIQQCICNCVPLIRTKACTKAWVFKVFLNTSLLTWKTFSANYWLIYLR